MLTDKRIQDAAEALSSGVIDSRNSGSIHLGYGIHGHMVLLHDRIGRWLEESDDDRKLAEVDGMAQAALVALAMSLPESVEVGTLVSEIRQADDERDEELDNMFNEGDEDDEESGPGDTETEGALPEDRWESAELSEEGC